MKNETSYSLFTNKVMWSPDRNKVTAMGKFRQLINRKYGLNLGKYQELYHWSCENYADFWKEFFHFSAIKYSKVYTTVVDPSKGIQDIPKWFEGCRLNFAENLLRWNDDKVAIYSAKESDTDVKQMTYAQLRMSVARYAWAMRDMGIECGDRVVGYIPNCAEAIEASLAAASIGAIWSSTSPDFGVTGVLDRFTQIKPKLIFSVNAVRYNGRVHNHMDKLKAVIDGLPDIEKVVIIPFVQESPFETSDIRNSCTLDSFLVNSPKQPDLPFRQVSFDHPLYIMYSSGTTGVPKCMVHSVGGTLIQHAKEHMLHGDMTREDIMFYYTTTGWMMWNWLVGCLALGSAVFTYDGSPLVPNSNVLWDYIEKIGVTIFGTSAKWLAVMEERNVKPAQTHSLTRLRSILSTGSPLKAESYEYVYKDIKKDLLLGSISGGTDIVSCFLGHNPTIPVISGEVQSFNLAMAMDCYSPQGKPVLGEAGELVCTKPFPCMPTRFWNDPSGEKYQKAYFRVFKGVWHHGDFCAINPDTHGIVMLGRSDGVLNPSGVRFGSSEIYNIVESFKEISDSLCVAQRNKEATDERVVLFLKMADGATFNDELVGRVKSNIRFQLSARHVPAAILETRDIPYTISGKKVEVAVRDMLAGREVKNKSALANPHSLELYANLPELADF